MTVEPLKLLILGAHPDDAEFSAGGLIARYRQLGHTVKMVAVTNGASGHHEQRGPSLVERRRRELAAAAAKIGATSEVWDNPDGFLLPTLDVREQVIREIRTFAPDLVLTHRTCDYHPDHRAVGQAVQDASYLVTVPAVVPDTPILRRDPVVAFLPDHFTRPTPLRADVVLDVGPYLETVLDMLCCHESQVFEWLPYNQRRLHEVPADAAGRREFVRRSYVERLRDRATRYPGTAELIEVFEISEYATQPDAAERARLFPA